VQDLLPSGEDLDDSSTESLVHGMNELDADMDDTYAEKGLSGVTQPRQPRKRRKTITVKSNADDLEEIDEIEPPASKSRRTRTDPKVDVHMLSSESEYSDVERSLTDMKGREGRPRKAGVDELWIKKRRRRDAKHVRVCKTRDHGCSQIFEKRLPDRMLGQSRDCPYLEHAARVKVNEGMAEQAPSERLKAFSSATTSLEHPSDEVHVSKNTIRPAFKSSQPSFYAIAKQARIQQQQTQLDADVTAVVCACGIPPSVLDHPVWKRLFRNLAPDLTLPSGSTVEDAYILREASAIKLRKIAQLRTQGNLTISFDGGGMRSSQSSTSCHVTQENGEVVFLACENDTGHSHTAEYLFEFLDKVC
jgi:hypothetical protein